MNPEQTMETGYMNTEQEFNGPPIHYYDYPYMPRVNDYSNQCNQDYHSQPYYPEQYYGEDGAAMYYAHGSGHPVGAGYEANHMGGYQRWAGRGNGSLRSRHRGLGRGRGSNTNRDDRVHYGVGRGRGHPVEPSDEMLVRGQMDKFDYSSENKGSEATNDANSTHRHKSYRQNRNTRWVNNKTGDTLNNVKYLYKYSLFSKYHYITL